MSKENKQTLTILLLILFTPVGLVLMFVWQLWSRAVRYLILGIFIFLLVISLVVVGLIFAGGLFLLNQDVKNKEATSQIYKLGDTARANGIEFTVTDFSSFETRNNILDEAGSYCGLSYSVKNTGDNELLLNNITDFSLTINDKEVSQFFSVGEEIVTKPEGLTNFLDTTGVYLDPNQQESYFLPFSCPEGGGQYRLYVNINQYGDYILDSDFESIKFDLNLLS